MNSVRHNILGSAAASANLSSSGSLSRCSRAAGFKPQRGSGPTRGEARDVSDFTRVEVDNGIGLIIQLGGTHAVEVQAQDNVLPLIATTVEGEHPQGPQQ